MSGVAGLMYLDGRVVDGLQIQEMSAALAHRGPDGGGVWSEGSVGLGHRLLHTTPESLHEAQPRAGGDGGVVLTADARIDNRAELIRLLGLSGRPAAEITDSELILAAYEKWGEQCPQRLLGDFSFAIWDAREQRLFCARDYYGTKPFFYHHAAGRLFAFGSEIKALLTQEEVPREVDRDQIGRFMHWNWGSGASTFHAAVKRLPAAHALSVTRAGVNLWRYWWAADAPDVRYRSSEEYEEAFREVFFEAIRCRLRSAFPVGSMLSGGVDSSSIACTAQHLLAGGTPLHTYSLVFDATPDCDERPFIHAALAQGDFTPHFIQGDDISPLEELDRVLWQLDEPPHVCLYALPWAKYRAAAGDSVRVLLDGLMGDEVLGNRAGEWHLTDLARRGRVLQLMATTARYARNTRRSPLLVLRKEVARPLASPAVARAWRRLRGRPAHENDLSGTSGAFMNSTHGANPAHRPQAGRNPRRTPRERHAIAVDPRAYHGPFSLAESMAAAHGVEVRYPFIDRRVVEFCVGLPTDQKFLGGWPRSIIRRSLGGILPEEIRWRTDKGHLTTWYKRGIAAIERERFDSMLFPPPREAEEFIDFRELRRVFDDYRSGNDSVLTSAIWMPFIISTWLQRSSPSVTGALV